MKIDARTNKYFSYFSSGNNNPANGFRGVARSPEFGYMYIVYTTTGYRHEGRAGAFWQVGATEYDIM